MIAALSDRDPRATLSVLGRHLRAAMGVLWEVDGEELQPRTVWLEPSVPASIEDATRALRLGRGQGKPGQVWVTGMAHWETRFASNDAFLRARVALASGLHSGVWFPIRAFDEVLGVVELLLRDEAEPVPELLEGLRLVGQVLGLHLHTIRSQDARLADEVARRTLLERAVEARDRQVRVLEQTLRRFYESDVFGMGIGTFDGRITEANDEHLRMLGYSRDELATLRWDDITARSSTEADLLAARQLREHGVAKAYEKEFIRKDGTRIPVLLGAAVLDDQHAICFAIDNSARKTAERELAALNAELERRVAERGAALAQSVRTIEAQARQIARSEEELRALARRLMQMREETGAAIAREIHDVLGTELTGLKMDTAWVLRRLAAQGRGTDEISGRLGDVLDSIDRLVITIRRIATELRPQILDDLGLVAALRWYTRTFAERCALRIDVDLPDELPLDAERSTALFRITQELLTNVARHARASAVAVRLVANQQVIELSVRDDGCGLPEPSPSGESLGLVGVRERAQALGGGFALARVATGGTDATAWIPRP